MSSNQRPPDLKAMLERAQPTDPYDVEAGIARHRALIGAGTPPPAWARAIRLTSAKGYKTWLGIGVLVVGLGGLSVRFGWPSQDRFEAERGAAAHPSSSPLHAANAAYTAPPSASAQQSPRGTGRVTPPIPLVTPLEDAPTTKQDDAPEPVRGALGSAPVLERQPPTLAETTPRRGAPTTKLRRGDKTAAPPNRSSGAAAAPSTHHPEEAVASVGVDDLARVLLADAPPSGLDHAKGEHGSTSPEQPSASPVPEVIDPEVLLEMEQVTSAERSLKSQPARTLAIVRAARQRFQPGYLEQERRYLEIMALLALGQVPDAELLSRTFFRDYPRGPYRARVESAMKAHRGASPR